MLQFIFSNIFGTGNFWGSYYIGDYKNGLKHGKGEFYKPNGAVYKGQFENDKINGHGTMINFDGTEKTGKWENGIIQR